MEQSKDLATIVKPLSINHETLLIYTSLKQCMANNEELRKALVEAAETINKLSEALNECHS